MKFKNSLLKKSALTGIAALLAGGIAWADGKDSAGQKPAAGSDSAVSQASATAEQRAAEERAKILEEAVGALAKTKAALRLLDDGQREQAIDTLSIAIGKLEIITARDPDLALAPVDVRFITQDFYQDAKAVKEALRKVEDLLDDHQVQEARAILRDLGSEIVVRVVNIPLATYPAAIKAIIPLIDDGKVAEAKHALQDVLSTLVIVDQVVPLPVLRAEALLNHAKALAAKEQRSSEENGQLEEFLHSARRQLELAEALGYGQRDGYRPLYRSLSDIEKKIAGGKSEKGGLFDKLRRQLDDFLSSLS